MYRLQLIKFSNISITIRLMDHGCWSSELLTLTIVMIPRILEYQTLITTLNLKTADSASIKFWNTILTDEFSSVSTWSTRVEMFLRSLIPMRTKLTAFFEL